MHLKSLKINNFRNFESSKLQFSDGANVLYGQNGSGKTNILEAIFVLLLSRSPRGAPDSVMINNDSDFYRLEGEVSSDNRDYNLGIGAQRGGRKKISINKLPVRPGELFEKFSAVSAAPGDVDLAAGPPSKRRDFLNIYLSQASQKYISDLTDYQKVLAQKNAFLKQDNATTETPYNDLLIQYGVEIMKRRFDFLEEIGLSANNFYKKISSGQKLSLIYKPSVQSENNSSIDAMTDSFRAKIIRYREREKILHTSLVGPHRDEIEIVIGDYPARTHGSQGELRTAAVAMKLAVFEYLRRVRRATPILLLDEIFAELDINRQQLLIELFGDLGQLFLTSASHLPESLSGKVKKFKIENGTVFLE